MPPFQGTHLDEGVIARLLRARTELDAMRADSLTYLAEHRGCLEKLLNEVSSDSLTADERFTLAMLIRRLNDPGLH